MPQVTLRKVGKKPSDKRLKRAYDVSFYAHESASHLLGVFDTANQSRGRGAPTDEQVDLLRAMVVFSGAGLDAVVKQLVRDCLPALIDLEDESIAKEVFTATERLLSRNAQDGARIVDAAVATRVLLSKDPRANLVTRLQEDYTARSLQSVDELLRCASLLGVDQKTAVPDPNGLKAAFTWRNQIAHEMDVDFAQLRRNRRTRQRDEAVSQTNLLLETASNFISGVGARLS